jgi:hypothetical protein
MGKSRKKNTIAGLAIGSLLLFNNNKQLSSKNIGYRFGTECDNNEEDRIKTKGECKKAAAAMGTKFSEHKVNLAYGQGCRLGYGIDGVGRGKTVWWNEYDDTKPELFKGTLICR